MKQFLRNFYRDTGGATAIEYGLIAALIAVAAITLMQSLSEEPTTFNKAESAIEGDGEVE